MPTIKLPEQKAVIPEKWSYESSKSFEITNSLLDLFDNKKLEIYINNSLKNNFNIKAAIARLKASNFLLKGTKGDFLPEFNADASKINHNQDIDLINGKRIITKNYKTSLNISWEIDLWGRIADNYSAEKFGFMSKQADFINFKDTLAARAIQGWIKAVSSATSIKTINTQIYYLKLLKKHITRKYKKGIISVSELFDIRQKLRDTKSRLIELKEEHKRDIRNLEILGGLTPDNKLFVDTILPDIKLVAFKSPSEIIKNRPDVKKGLADLKSMRLLSKVAKKRLLPSINLSGSISKDGNNYKLLKSADILWNIIGSLTQPLFSRGQLIAEYKAQSLEARSVLWDLQNTILIALKEVEDALGREKSLYSRILQIEKIFYLAQKKYKYQEIRYKHGLTDYYIWLLGRIELNELKNNINQLRVMHLMNRVDLALAMGIGVKNYTYKNKTKEKIK